jgi:hypothetical protein
MSWALSWSTVSRFFETTSLVTDSPGARLLVDGVGLPFDSVVTSLDQIGPANSAWWTLGKLRAYRQTSPFLHFDSDVFLWTALPGRLLTAEVAAQNPEAAPLDDSSYYKPTRVSETLERLGGWLPQDLREYVHGGGSTAACTGVFGGCAWESIAEYAATAEQLILSRPNQRAWDHLSEPFRDSVFVEQYYLAAYCKARSGANPRYLSYLFASQAESFSPGAAAERGYTHLISSSKRSPRLMALMRRRLRDDYPVLYDSCLRAADAVVNRGTRGGGSTFCVGATSLTRASDVSPRA